MDYLCLGCILAYFAYLAAEARAVRAARGRLAHVVHVNGTRGKSSVSRLIAAGLRAGGLRVFCKTTGTDPMTIDVEGRDRLIRRRGRPNIREQAGVLRAAAAQRAQVLVVECMAITPELQRASQRAILRADIGVITNVRRDHTDVMGQTPEAICDALSNSIPPGGVLFTAETAQLERLSQNARALNCQTICARAHGDEGEFDFAENIALALAVCARLGVARETALAGMRGYHRDPYALSEYRFGGARFINGLSINDIESIGLVWAELAKRRELAGLKRILLVNNRADRPSRTQDMLRLCASLRPDAVWLMGAAQRYMRRGLCRALPGVPVRAFRRAAEIDADALGDDELIFAVGNLAGAGRALIQRVRGEGRELV